MDNTRTSTVAAATAARLRSVSVCDRAWRREFGPLFGVAARLGLVLWRTEPWTDVSSTH